MNYILECILIAQIVWIVISSIIAVVLHELDMFKLLGMDFIWFDIWIGIYYDREKRIIYINPFPCLVYSFQWVKEKDVER